jgi:hypothetical protein
MSSMMTPLSDSSETKLCRSSRGCPLVGVHAIAVAGRKRLADGDEIDEVLAYFKAEGLGILPAIRATMIAFELRLVEARELVESSPAFNSRPGTAVHWHQEVLQRLKPTVDALRGRITPVATPTTNATSERRA